jgi:hypothetical protein
MARLAKKAKSLGITPEEYVLQLIEEDLALEQKAKTLTFAQIMGPDQDVDEALLDRLVDEARTRHHLKSRRKR